MKPACALLTAAALVLVRPLGAQTAGPTVSMLASALPAACADSLVPPPGEREPASYRPPQRRGIAVPPLEAADPPRGRLLVEFLVNVRGTVDSVAIVGEVTPGFLRLLRATLLTHTFWPATYRGCAVPGRMAVEMTFP